MVSVVSVVPTLYGLRLSSQHNKAKKALGDNIRDPTLHTTICVRWALEICSGWTMGEEEEGATRLFR